MLYVPTPCPSCLSCPSCQPCPLCPPYPCPLPLASLSPFSLRGPCSPCSKTSRAKTSRTLPCPAMPCRVNFATSTILARRRGVDNYAGSPTRTSSIRGGPDLGHPVSAPPRLGWAPSAVWTWSGCGWCPVRPDRLIRQRTPRRADLRRPRLSDPIGPETGTRPGVVVPKFGPPHRLGRAL